MTSRERVLAAVNFREADRVPIDLGGTRASGINAVVYDRLKRRMGIATPTKIHDAMQILAELEPEVLDRLGVDVVPLEAATARWARQDAQGGRRSGGSSRGRRCSFRRGRTSRRSRTAPGRCGAPDGTPYARMPKDGFYFDFIRPTMSGRRIDPNAFQPSRDGAGRGPAAHRAARARPLREHRQGDPRLGRGDQPPRDELAAGRQHHAGLARRMALHAHGGEGDRERDDGPLRGRRDRRG